MFETVCLPFAKWLHVLHIAFRQLILKQPHFIYSLVQKSNTALHVIQIKQAHQTATCPQRFYNQAVIRFSCSRLNYGVLQINARCILMYCTLSFYNDDIQKKSKIFDVKSIWFDSMKKFAWGLICPSVLQPDATITCKTCLTGISMRE